MTTRASGRLSPGRKCLFAFAVLLQVFSTGTSAVDAKILRPIIVSSDRGGPINQRRAEISQMQLEGQRVELRGLCLSSCTMYLGMKDVCVDRAAVFGFHGPSMNGRPLPQAGFDYWSSVMAKAYRPALRQWFMETGRYRFDGYYKLSGADLVDMGYKAC